MPLGTAVTTVSPHKIPDRANLWALRSLGVLVSGPYRRGLTHPRARPRPGHFDNRAVDRTIGRTQTF